MKGKEKIGELQINRNVKETTNGVKLGAEHQQLKAQFLPFMEMEFQGPTLTVRLSSPHIARAFQTANEAQTPGFLRSLTPSSYIFRFYRRLQPSLDSPAFLVQFR